MRDGLEPRESHLRLAHRSTETSLTGTVVLPGAGCGAPLNLGAAGGDVALVESQIRVARLDACDLLTILGALGASSRSIITILASLDNSVPTDRLQLAVLSAGIALSAAGITLLAICRGEDAIAADATAEALVLVQVADAEQVHERRSICPADLDARFDAGQRLRGGILGGTAFKVVHDGACIVGPVKVVDQGVGQRCELAAPAFAVLLRCANRANAFRVIPKCRTVQCEVLVSIRSLMLVMQSEGLSQC